MTEEVLQDFRTFCACKNYRPRTIDSYESCLKKFLLYFKRSPKDITLNEVYSFLSNIPEVNTKKQYVGALRILYSHVRPQKNKLKKIQYPKKEKHIPVALTPTEVDRCLSSIKNLKHRAMIELAWVCALRISEVINLKVRHISRENVIFIEDSKGAKDRIIPIPEETLQLLREYYRSYFKLVSKDDYLFPGQNGLYSPTSIRNVFNRSTTGINKKVKFHSLRHSRATHWMNKGLSMHEVAKLLGHSSIKTTEIYLHTSIDNLKSRVLEV